MRIFSDIIANPQGDPAFVLYFDTQKTGDPNKDCLYTAADFKSMANCTEPEEILNFIIPMLSELLYTVYGEDTNKKPITDWHATGFDRNKPNGVA